LYVQTRSNNSTNSGALKTSFTNAGSMTRLQKHDASVRKQI